MILRPDYGRSSRAGEVSVVVLGGGGGVAVGSSDIVRTDEQLVEAGQRARQFSSPGDRRSRVSFLFRSVSIGSSNNFSVLRRTAFLLIISCGKQLSMS